jgi:hypothetical protein
MWNETGDHRSGGDDSISRIAHVVGRIGLAIAGSLCGFYVAADLLRANLGGLNSTGFVISMSLLGMIGFYLGIDLPRTRAHGVELTGGSFRLVELLSAVGTLLAAIAALASVYVIVFDEVPRPGWTLVVGLWWLLGVVMQIGAGAMARWRLASRATG